MNAPAFKDHFFRARDGLNLHARDYGLASSKLPVVCIPGLTRNCRDFEDVAPWIAGIGRRVLAIDLRGRGLSDRDANRRNYKPAVYADDISALLRSIREPKALFIGTSLGGLVIMTLAVRHLGQIGGAVLNDAGPQIAKPGLIRLAGYVGKGAGVKTWDDASEYAKRINGVAFPHYVEADWGRVARRMFKEDATGAPELDYDAHISSPVHPLLVRLVSPLAWAAFKRLARNRPTLIVRGELSDILDTATVTRMQRAAPRITVAEVPGVGHAPILDEPEAKAALKALFESAQ